MLMLLKAKRPLFLDFILGLIFPASMIAFHSAHYNSDAYCIFAAFINLASIVVMVPLSALNLIIQVGAPRGHAQYIKTVYKYGDWDMAISYGISASLIILALATTCKVYSNRKREELAHRPVDKKIEYILLLLNPSSVTARHCKSRIRTVATDLLEVFSVASVVCLVARLWAKDTLTMLYDNYPDTFKNVNVELVVQSLSITTIVMAVFFPAPYILALCTLNRKPPNSDPALSKDTMEMKTI